MSASDRRVIALGNLGGDLKATLESAVAQAGLELTLTREPSHALLTLERTGAIAVLVDTATLGSEQFCKRARGSERLRRVPIIALSRNPSELGFSRVFGWGADDLSPLLDPEPLAKRLKAVVAAGEAVVTATGQAVVAESTTQRRTIVGRVLVQAGYEVKFALDKQTTEAYCSESETRIAVCSAQMADPRKLIDFVAAAGALPTWIITTEASSVNRLARSLAGLDRVAVTSNAGSPEDLLFLANELVFGRGGKRREWRALYGTPVAFRPHGAYRDEYGFSYDVSPTGVYVRSLLPCEADTVEVELRPPRSEERLKLTGTIVRRFAFGSGSVASAPPGFAVKLSGPASALAAWEHACRELIHVAGVGSPPSLRPSGPPRAESQLAIPAASLRIETPDPIPPNADVGALLASTLGSEALPESGQRPVTVELGAERESMIPSLQSEPPPPMHVASVNMRTEPAPPLEEVEREPLPLPMPEIRASGPPPPPARKGPGRPPSRTFSKTLVGVAVPLPDPPQKTPAAPPAGGPPPRPASRSGAIALSPPLASAKPETPKAPAIAPPKTSFEDSLPQPLEPEPQGASSLEEQPPLEQPPLLQEPAPKPLAEESELPLELATLPPPAGDVLEDPFLPAPPKVVPTEALEFARTMVAGEALRAEEMLKHALDSSASPQQAALPSRLNVREAAEEPFEAAPKVPRVPTQLSQPPAPALDDAYDVKQPKVRKPGGRKLGLIATGVILTAAAAVGALALRNRSATPAEVVAPARNPPATPAPIAPPTAGEATVSSPPAAVPATASAVAEAPPSAEPAPTESAEPAASAAPEVDAAAPSASAAAPAVPDAPPAPDATKLAADRGLLLVRSSQTARVFVHGKDVGETNQYVETSCGIRFVRLGRAFADFIEPGRSVVLKCGKVNELSIEPLP